MLGCLILLVGILSWCVRWFGSVIVLDLLVSSFLTILVFVLLSRKRRWLSVIMVLVLLCGCCRVVGRRVVLP